MEPWRVCKPVVADLHQYDEVEEQDPDPEPHQSEKSDSDPHQSERRIRIRIKVMRICNTAKNTGW